MRYKYGIAVLCKDKLVHWDSRFSTEYRDSLWTKVIKSVNGLNYFVADCTWYLPRRDLNVCADRAISIEPRDVNCLQCLLIEEHG